MRSSALKGFDFALYSLAGPPAGGGRGESPCDTPRICAKWSKHVILDCQTTYRLPAIYLCTFFWQRLHHHLEGSQWGQRIGLQGGAFSSLPGHAAGRVGTQHGCGGVGRAQGAGAQRGGAVQGARRAAAAAGRHRAHRRRVLP